MGNRPIPVSESHCEPVNAGGMRRIIPTRSTLMWRRIEFTVASVLLAAAVLKLNQLFTHADLQIPGLIHAKWVLAGVSQAEFLLGLCRLR